MATDHVIESFRNGLWRGYKTSAGVPRDLLSQFPLLEEALTALGVVVWPMVEFEADDALASAARLAANRPARGARRHLHAGQGPGAIGGAARASCSSVGARGSSFDEAGVMKKFGVPPASIPDYLALVGDASDGYPGLPGWGAKSSAAVLARFGHIENIPADWRDWHANATQSRRAGADAGRSARPALLFRTLATLRSDVPLFKNVDELQWTGPTPAFDGDGGASGRTYLPDEAIVRNSSICFDDWYSTTRLISLPDASTISIVG